MLNHEKIVGYFESLGIPLPAFNAWFVGCVECFGSVLLALGLASGPVTTLLASPIVSTVFAGAGRLSSA